MKILGLLFILSSFVYSSEYYAKVQALNTYIIKSSVSGKVIYTNEKIEGFKSNNSLIIQIGDEVDIIDYKETKKKLSLLNEMIKIEEKNYNRLKKISSRSIFEKEAQRLKSINLKSLKSDLLIKLATLKNKVKNKKLYEKNAYIYSLKVKKGDYVNPGTILYEKKDLSAGKLEIFIPISDVNIIKNQKIYINSKLSSLKIEKIYEIADDKHLSSYKTIIIMPNVKTFSQLVKIEFK